MFYKIFVVNLRLHFVTMRLLILLFFLYSSIAGYSQKKKAKHMPGFDDSPIHFGISLGLNTMDYVITRNIESDKSLIAQVINPKPGFQINAVSDFRLGRYLSFRALPGVAFGSRTIDFYNLKDSLITSSVYESSYAEMPLLIKLKAERINNYRPYLIGGITPRFDFDSKKNFELDKTKPRYLIINKFDIYYDLGFGVDFYNQFFKFTWEIRLSLGALNIKNDKEALKYEDYSRSVKSIKSQMVLFTLYFE